MDIQKHISHRASDVMGCLRRSFISTNFSSEVNGFEDLTKSHIQKSLDRYSKINLTDNLPFVVVFQTIEIERLQRQLDFERALARQSKEQISMCSGNSLDNRHFSDRIVAAEHEKERYSEQNEKLNLICHQLYGELEEMKQKLSEVDFSATDKYHVQRSKNTELMMELDTWKARYTASQKSKMREVQDLRHMMDSQRKSMIDRDMREMAVRHQTERSNLENEIRKLRDCLEVKGKELEDARMRSGHYEVSMIEMNSTQNKLEDYENKLALISQEMMRLNELVKTKQEEIDMYKMREYQLGQKVKDQERWELQTKQLKSSVEMRSREVEQWRIKYMRMEESLGKIRQLESINTNLIGRMRDFERELERANGTVRDKLEQIEEWKRKLAIQQHETNRYKNLQREIESYQDKISVLTVEIQRLNHVLKGRLVNIDEWRSKYHSLQVTLGSYTAYERQSKQLNERLSQQFRIAEEVKGRLQKTEGELQIMRTFERKTHEQQSYIHNLNSEMQRLNTILRAKHQEMDDFKIKYNRLEASLSEYKYTEGRLRDYEDKINSLTQELERVNNVVRTKNQDLERATLAVRSLQQQTLYLRSYESKMVESEKAMMNLTMTMDNIKRQGNKWQDKFRIVESRCKELEESCYVTVQQKDKISNALRTKTFQLQEIRSKYNKMENDSFRAREIETSYYELQSRTTLMTTEFERMDRLYRELQANFQKQKTLSTELAFKVIILSAEVDRCQGSGGMKYKDQAELQEKLFYLQCTIKDKDSQTVVLLQKINSFEPKIAYLMSELDRYLSAITNNEKKTRQLQQQIAQYQDYTKSIGILSAEIDRLTTDNKLLDDDTRKIRMKYADQISQQLTQEKMMMLIVIMGAEIDSLRSRVTEKEAQFQEVRRSILSPIRNFEGDYRRF